MSDNPITEAILAGTRILDRENPEVRAMAAEMAGEIRSHLKAEGWRIVKLDDRSAAGFTLGVSQSGTTNYRVVDEL